jgi:hypothetical protein
MEKGKKSWSLGLSLKSLSYTESRCFITRRLRILIVNLTSGKLEVEASFLRGTLLIPVSFEPSFFN